MKKTLFVMLAAALLAASCSSKPQNQPASENNQPQTNQEQNQNSTASTPGNPITVEVDGSNFKFSPAEIRVKEGAAVTIQFKNTGGFHDFVIDEFNIRTPQIQGNQTAEVTFVANKKGTFEYYCSVGSHRQMGMKGNLIVE